MADNLTQEQRARNMANIRSRDTKPEIAVRSILHSLGYRFRLHHKKLAGKPDIVLPRHNRIVLVHGCFWHMHKCKRGTVTPKTNADYWTSKRVANVRRDKVYIKLYRSAGYKVLTVWECETQDIDKLGRRLVKFLSS